MLGFIYVGRQWAKLISQDPGVIFASGFRTPASIQIVFCAKLHHYHHPSWSHCALVASCQPMPPTLTCAWCSPIIMSGNHGLSVWQIPDLWLVSCHQSWFFIGRNLLCGHCRVTGLVARCTFYKCVHLSFRHCTMGQCHPTRGWEAVLLFSLLTFSYW